METAYEVLLDGERAWPPPPGDWDWPASCIRPLSGSGELRICFGSCRVAYPNEPPWTLRKDQDPRGREHDALSALAHEMRADRGVQWPQLLLLLGDQVYADDVPPRTAKWIAQRRDTSVPPGEQVADFHEYCRLYEDSWSEPSVRWLLSTVPTAMIFDDHDIHDDWNTSDEWVREMRGQGWWDERIVGGFMSYWAFQHLGNLARSERNEDPTYRAVLAGAGRRRADRPRLRLPRRPRDRRRALELLARRRRHAAGDDGLARRPRAHPRRRQMVDAEEWADIEAWSEGDFDHLLLGTSLPVALVSPGCSGWRRPARRCATAAAGGWWPAWASACARGSTSSTGPRSGRRSTRWRTSSSASRRDATAAAPAPWSCSRATCTTPTSCGPGSETTPTGGRRSTRRCARRFATRWAGTSGARCAWRSRAPGALVGAALARLARAPAERVRWDPVGEGPWFDNQVATLVLDGREGRLALDRSVGPPEGPPRLERVAEQRLT